jgi:hypothetical protein
MSFSHWFLLLCTVVVFYGVGFALPCDAVTMLTRRNEESRCPSTRSEGCSKVQASFARRVKRCSSTSETQTL